MLLVATIAIAFGGWIEVIAWLAVGLGAVETARRFRFRAVGIFGLALMAYALARLITYDFYLYHDNKPTLAIFSLAFTAWSAQILAAAGAFAVATWRTQYTAERSIAAPISLWLIAASMLHVQTDANALSTSALLLGAAGCWICVKFPIKTLRINAFVLAGIAMSILCMTQISSNGTGIEFDIRVIPMLIAALAWLSIAALPKATYTLRTISASLVVISGSIAIGRIEAAQGIPVTLLAQAGYLAVITILGKRFFAWSLPEIASVSAVTLIAGWCVYMLGINEEIMTLAPLSSVESFTPIAILASMFYAARTVATRPLPTDAPDDLDLVSSRRWLSNVLFGMFWFFTLVASSLEVTRATHLFFESDSALGAAISIWWSIYAVVSVSLGFKLPRQLRWAGLTLLCIVGAKVLFLDTMTLAQAPRIIASITVGLIIIATGVVYSRVVGNLSEPDSKPDSNPVSEPDSDNPDSDQPSSEPTE